eukprot:764851-Hanusia_phi.AAC.6
MVLPSPFNAANSRDSGGLPDRPQATGRAHSDAGRHCQGEAGGAGRAGRRGRGGRTRRMKRAEMQQRGGREEPTLALQAEKNESRIRGSGEGRESVAIAGVQRKPVRQHTLVRVCWERRRVT